MLNWRHVLAVSALTAAAGLLPPLPSTCADDRGDVTCGPFAGNCSLTAGGSSSPDPGSSGAPANGASGGSGSDSSGGGDCVFHGHSFPCYSGLFGWFDQADGCYYDLMDPQPDATSAYWAGHKPGDGAVYTEVCPLISGTGLPGGTGKWFRSPPPGYGGAVDVAALAQEAARRMALQGPAIGIAPKAGSHSLVGLPVWLWDNPGPTTWGPDTAQAAAGGVTVTATGQVQQILWSMGDGTSVTCATAGVPYQPSMGAQTPACGHVYTATSANHAGGAYPITATSTWVVDWTATTGQTGQITVHRQSRTSAAIGEAAALNTN